MSSNEIAICHKSKCHHCAPIIKLKTGNNFHKHSDIQKHANGKQFQNHILEQALGHTACYNFKFTYKAVKKSKSLKSDFNQQT